MKQASLLKYFSNQKPKEPLQVKDENQEPDTQRKRRLRQVEDEEPKQMEVEVTPEKNGIEQRYQFSALIEPSPTTNKKSIKLSGKSNNQLEIEEEEEYQSNNKPSQKQKQKDKQKEKDQNSVVDKTNIIKENKALNDLSEFDDATPEWAQVGKSRDANRVLHGSIESDPTSLYIPDAEFKKLTKSMQQYWSIKRQNFDKVIFFKLGKFYELFYDDAMIGHRYLELNWMGRKMHTGFPEKCIGKYGQMLIGFGFKVAVVDQVETPEEMERRIKENRKSGVGNVEKIVQRELSQVVTRGTFQDDEESCADERILMVIRKNIIRGNEEEYGVVMLESQTNVITLAYVDNMDKLKTLILQMKPLEVVVELHNVPMYDPIVGMLKNQAIGSQISPMSKKGDNWDGRKGLVRVEKALGSVPDCVEQFRGNDLVLSALNGLYSYLETVLILDRVLETARYRVYNPKSIALLLDSQALSHLEILQSGSSQKDMSLLGVIDRTVSGGGHRMLRRWLCSPLYNIQQIESRQDSVQDLCKFKKERDQFRQALKSYPDFERVCSRIYQYSVKSVSKAIFYENLSQIRLKEFRNLIIRLREAQSLLNSLASLKSYFSSKRLIQILTTVDGGLLPDVQQFLDEFETYITWDGNTPTPREGVLESYDEARKIVKERTKVFDEYLISIRRRFKNDCNVNYAHVKFRYELEIPTKLVEQEKPQDFEFSSARNGYQRFHTKELKDMVFDLEEAENQEKKQLTQFVQFVFKHFQGNYRIWDAFVQILNELDALCSMSVWSEQSDGIMCRPKFISDQEQPLLEIVDGRHPCLCMTGLNFIPNTIDMGIKNPLFLLLSGPNMGGKSTTLRMTCVLTILAQMGSMVPCYSMQLTPVDRIFTRIGAYDQLMQGKSTFYVELEETLVPLMHGSRNSLFISDELGRGTSTYDGVAIASSVMHYLIDRIGCRVLFATHFRMLIEEVKRMKDVVNVHMGCYIENENVVFLYRLKEGECPASFGINVARAVGMPGSVIEKAKKKASKFDENKGVLREFKRVMISLYD